MGNVRLGEVQHDASIYHHRKVQNAPWFEASGSGEPRAESFLAQGTMKSKGTGRFSLKSNRFNPSLHHLICLLMLGTTRVLVMIQVSLVGEGGPENKAARYVLRHALEN